MTLARCVADVLTDHVVFEVECIDRMYLNVYVPRLQYATGLVQYIHRQMGMPVASTAVLAPLTGAYVQAVHRYAGIVSEVLGDGIKALFGTPESHHWSMPFIEKTCSTLWPSSWTAMWKDL